MGAGKLKISMKTVCAFHWKSSGGYEKMGFLILSLILLLDVSTSSFGQIEHKDFGKSLFFKKRI